MTAKEQGTKVYSCLASATHWQGGGAELGAAQAARVAARAAKGVRAGLEGWGMVAVGAVAEAVDWAGWASADGARVEERAGD